jgi:hypothetical protein
MVRPLCGCPRSVLPGKGGTKSAAINLYRKRKTEALEGKKLPEKLRRRAVPFSELCDDTAAYISENYSHPQHDLGRLDTIRTWFASRSAESITSPDIKAAPSRGKEKGKWSNSSYNHHHTLLSLTYRLGIEHEKVEQNPAHGVRRKTENNSRVRVAH